LRQGDALSTSLLNIVLEKMIRNAETNLNETVFNTTRQYTCIAFADDVLILGQLVRAIEVVVTQINPSATEDILTPTISTDGGV